MRMKFYQDESLNEMVRMMRVNINKYIPKIDRVIYNDPATIVYFKDGTKTVVKRNGNGEYDEFSGLTAALAKRIYGLKELNKHIPAKKEEPQLNHKQCGDFDGDADTEENFLTPNETVIYDCDDTFVEKSNLKLWSFDVDENEFTNENAAQGKYIYKISVDRKHLRIIYRTGATDYEHTAYTYAVYKLEELKTILICLRDNEDNYKTIELNNIDGSSAPSINATNLIGEFSLVMDLMKADCFKKIKDRDLNLNLRGYNDESM